MNLLIKNSHITLQSRLIVFCFHPTTLIEIAVYCLIHVTISVDKYPKPMILQSHILHHKCNQTMDCKADNLFILVPYLFTELFTRNALEISLRPGLQIDNSFFF